MGDFKRITNEMGELYEKKNKDYGNTFTKGYEEYGMIMPLIRIEDKFNRFKQLTVNDEIMIKTESLRDTLIDLANYTVMTIMELDKKEGEYE